MPVYSSVTCYLNAREVLNEITGIRMRVMLVKGFTKKIVWISNEIWQLNQLMYRAYSWGTSF